MRVLFLTDSLSFPRNYNGEVVEYEETYQYLLKQNFPTIDFVFASIGGGTSRDLYKQAVYYKMFKPDVVILQCGVVDCAPRAFRLLERKFLAKIKLLSFFKPFLKKLRKYRGIVYVNKRNFKNNLNLIKAEFTNDPEFYAIGILPVSDEYENLIPKMKNQVTIYNKILQEEFDNFITTQDLPWNGILNDFHHLNGKGHHYVYKKIHSILNK